ncbi:hypothetical protein FRC0160_01963 [Corynebacterium diphtheriae]|nr:hypothetical protein BKD84_10650 [Corynebacterium diphtheriae]OWN03787.1 hypothetical protein AY499_07020 [Corynebacterium diphtheriae bv. gravis]CAB0622178.1 hypothetical protein CIP107544_02167 [Corynebacterium diphtheriae]CAB0709756.1 hypothetical protein FRC0076_01947 [Corynebacterium diphtheriae]CAB0710186.1 hypothetical protein FRC0077_01956 [Corynebacterium diphtheriae]
MARLVLEPVVQELVLAQAVAVLLGFFAFEACFVFCFCFCFSRSFLNSVWRRASSLVSCLACSASLSYSFWCAASAALTRVS